jgi:hypothetical protein
MSRRTSPSRDAPGADAGAAQRRRAGGSPAAEVRRPGLVTRVAVGALVGAVAVAGGLVWTLTNDDSRTTGPTDPQELSAESGRGSADMPPWSLPRDPRARAEMAGLPMGPMGTAQHYHPRLRVTVDGKPVPVPANIGVDPATGEMSAVHTHSADGVVHVEAAETGQTFTLGQLFTLWDVRLGPDQIGGLSPRDGRLTASVGGEAVSRDPALIELQPGQRVSLDFRRNDN